MYKLYWACQMGPFHNIIPSAKDLIPRKLNDTCKKVGELRRIVSVSLSRKERVWWVELILCTGPINGNPWLNLDRFLVDRSELLIPKRMPFAHEGAEKEKWGPDMHVCHSFCRQKCCRGIYFGKIGIALIMYSLQWDCSICSNRNGVAAFLGAIPVPLHS